MNWFLRTLRLSPDDGTDGGTAVDDASADANVDPDEVDVGALYEAGSPPNDPNAELSARLAATEAEINRINAENEAARKASPASAGGTSTTSDTDEDDPGMVALEVMRKENAAAAQEIKALKGGIAGIQDELVRGRHSRTRQVFRDRAEAWMRGVLEKDNLSDEAANLLLENTMTYINTTFNPEGSVEGQLKALRGQVADYRRRTKGAFATKAPAAKPKAGEKGSKRDEALEVNNLAKTANAGGAGQVSMQPVGEPVKSGGDLLRGYMDDFEGSS